MSRLHAWTWADYARSAAQEEMRARTAAWGRRVLAQQDGAEGRPAAGGVARVLCGAPSAAAPGSGRDVTCTQDVSLTWASAVPVSRSVSPAAGAAFDAAPAGFLGARPSPGVCWARVALVRGVALDKVLRSGGDRLTFRDRAALRAEGAR